MASTNVSVKEFMEMATLVYGENWRILLSDELGLRSETLVLALGDSGPVARDLSTPLLKLVEEKLDAMGPGVASTNERVRFLLGDQCASVSSPRFRRPLAS